MTHSRWGPFVLLVSLILLLAACAPATQSPGDLAIQRTMQAVQVCGTAVALNMPNPCAPTPTPSPLPTATQPPTPTAIPFTGWRQYTEDGEYVRDMPSGWEPSCDSGATKIVGCPGKTYIKYVNGMPVPPDQGGLAGTPGYWPYVLIGVPAAIALLVLLFYTAFQNTAPFRAAAEATRQMAKSFGQTSDSQQAALPEHAGVLPYVELKKLITGFLATRRDHVAQFRPIATQFLGGYRDSDEVPFTVGLAVFHEYDRRHKAGLAKQFGDFLVQHHKR